MGFVEKAIATMVPTGAILEYQQAAKQAETALEVISRIVSDYWPYLLALLALLIVARYGKNIFGGIVDRRVHDAKTGRNSAV